MLLANKLCLSFSQIRVTDANACNSAMASVTTLQGSHLQRPNWTSMVMFGVACNVPSYLNAAFLASLGCRPDVAERVPHRRCWGLKEEIPGADINELAGYYALFKGSAYTAAFSRNCGKLTEMPAQPMPSPAHA